MPNFSHLNTDSEFPGLENVNVYQFDNDFDYGRFNYKQMSLQLCDVPWDVGEAHVGQRTISGIGNVVYFGSTQKRDEWFNAIPEASPGEDPTGKCFRFTTKFKELHRDQIIDVPIPYNVAALFNYLVVEYVPFANDDSYVEYETGKGKLKWFWFVREVEFIAPNTTRLYLLDDAFQTWIYDINIAGMVLERGHAPMFETKAQTYLENPVANNTGLLTPDVNYGQTSQVVHMDALTLNSGEMWACVATSANPQGSWGSKQAGDWHVPTLSLYQNNGVPSYYVFALDPGQLSTFFSQIQQSFPQFVQTIQGVFFVPRNLVTVESDFTFASVQCHGLSSSRTTLDLARISKGHFAYPAKYADIAKLYTSPYAHLEITDETGSVNVVNIEDTTGNIDVSCMLSLAFPYINISTHLMGVGGTAQASVTFRNVTGQTFNVQGTWYETLRNWDIPTFAVTLNPQSAYDFSTHFNRAQQTLDYQTAYNNALASAATDKSNADASADTGVSNTAIQVAGNSTVNSRSNSAALSDTNLANLLSQASQAYEAGYARATVNNEINAEYASAAIGAAGGVIGSTVSGAMAGGPIGAVGGLISGAISGATSMATTSVNANLKSDQAEAGISLSQSKVTSTNTNNTERTTNQNSANSDNTSTTNSAATGIAANNAATQKNNATRTKSTQEANAAREQTRASTAIANEIKQAALNAPSVGGAFANGESAVTKPMALFCNVVTQSRSAIAATGDEFLRYGYMYDMQWAFDGNWNIGKYFTYWKLKDFWVRDLQVPDLYMDKIRFFLFGGVTIWRKPEYIGKVNIYDNFNG